MAGADAASTLLAELQRLGSQRALLITTRSLSQRSDCATRLISALDGRCVAVFDEIRSHTPREDVMQAVTIARQVKADLLVSLGGGSVIDATKVVQLALTQNIHTEQNLIEYAQFADGSRGASSGVDTGLVTPTIRQIAIPTTLSGAEFSSNAGVMDTVKGLKEGYRANHLCPRSIIYDPALSLHTPEWLWLSTAIRSLDHAIEGYCSSDSTSYLEAHFLHAMKLFAESLPETKKTPQNLASRSLNQQAVWLACAGLGKVAHGASHGIGYLLGGVCGVPHGYTSCVMLPAVLQWNAVVNGQRQEGIAAALGKPNSSAAEAVRELVSGLGLPVCLRDLDLKKEQLSRIAELACKHPVVKRNPRPVSSPQDVMEILTLAW